MISIYTFYADAVRIALQSIFAHKLRAFLTLIGIIIGVASVVVVGASISGLNAYVMERVTSVLGINHFMIARMAHDGELSDEEWEKRNRRNKKLEWEDYEWIVRHCAACQEVGAQMDTSTDIKHESEETLGTRISGVTANMAQVEDKTVIEGRFVLPNEVDNSSMVCVIGMDLREKFFAGQDPLGKELNVRGLPLRIVGVEEKRGSMFGQSFDNTLYMPLTTFRKIFGARQGLQIHGKAAAREQFQAAIEDARTALRNKHKLKGNDEDDFGLVNTEDVGNDVDSFTGAIAMVVIPITLISLVVGGIVVMNIMLVSVTERTFEVGLRKALGATRKQILLQFLIESAFLTSCGGMFGLLLAVGIAWIVRVTTSIPMTVTIVYVLLSILFSCGIGIIAGIYPAYKAARLDPIVALTQN